MSITQGLRRALQVKKNATATLYKERRRTWGEVGARVAKMAGALQSLGMKKGDRVALLMLNSDFYLELYLAVAWGGGVIVPLNVRWSAMENEDALKDCRAKILFIDAAFGAIGAGLQKSIDGLILVHADDTPAPAGMHDYEALLAKATAIADVNVDEKDMAGIFYTGGTTGRSKGVMLSHRNLASNARSVLSEGIFAPGCTYLHCAPMFHLANGCALFGVLLGASTNAILQSFTPQGLAEAIEKYRVTESLLVPTMIQMFVDHPASTQHDLSSFKRIVYGASPISEAVLDRAMARLPHVEFVQAYGMTELSPLATILPWADHIGEGRAKGRHRAAGRATFTVDVRIVDANDKPVATGEVGEIVARGDNVMLGYWERPEETARAIIDGWMHTGDGGRMDEDGYVYVVDRVKDMIISGGENIYSTEVENAVALHPAVAQCAVVGIPHEHWGETVHAVVVRKPGVEVSAEEIIQFCKDRIAGYKCPRSVDIRDEPLPLSGAGKILKRELRAPFWEKAERGVA